MMLKGEYGEHEHRGIKFLSAFTNLKEIGFELGHVFWSESPALSVKGFWFDKTKREMMKLIDEYLDRESIKNAE